MPLRLNEIGHYDIDQAKISCKRLVALARPGGPLAASGSRGRLAARAEWLLLEIARLESELMDLPWTEADEAEIAARAGGSCNLEWLNEALNSGDGTYRP